MALRARYRVSFENRRAELSVRALTTETLEAEAVLHSASLDLGQPLESDSGRGLVELSHHESEAIPGELAETEFVRVTPGFENAEAV